MEKINLWFLDNFNINIERVDNIKLKESIGIINEEKYTTEKIKDMLTDSDISEIIELNSIDYMLYQYEKKQK